MRVYCYECKKEVKLRCSRCGHDRARTNSPVGICAICNGRFVCPVCGGRRFRAQ